MFTALVVSTAVNRCLCRPVLYVLVTESYVEWQTLSMLHVLSMFTYYGFAMYYSAHAVTQFACGLQYVYLLMG